MRHLTSHETPRLPRCSQVVAGQCLSSPQQGWLEDPGWAPLSRRRSLAPWTFLCLPIWSLSCELQHFLIAYLWYYTCLGFCNFYDFFWANRLCGLLWFFFRRRLLLFPLCDLIFLRSAFPYLGKRGKFIGVKGEKKCTAIFQTQNWESANIWKKDNSSNWFWDDTC